MSIIVQTSYMRRIFHDPAVIVGEAKVELRRHGVDFDTVIGTGLSGALAMPILGRGLGIHWAVVRKPNDGTHSDNEIEGTIGDRWLFVDDFTETGATLGRVRQVVDRVCKYYGHTSEYVGAYLYYVSKFKYPGSEVHY